MLSLATPVSDLSSIAAKNKSQLKRLGITNIRELLWHLPIRWEDFSHIVNIADVSPESRVVVVAKIHSVAARRGWRSKKHLTEAIIEDGTGKMKAVWFNQPYLTKVLASGKTFYLAGKVVDYYGLTLSNPIFERFDAKTKSLHFVGLTPIYPATEKLTQKQLRFLVKTALDKKPAVIEHLPKEYTAKECLMSLPEAVENIHFPEDNKKLKQAIYRLKFEELWQIYYKSRAVREKLAELPAYPIATEKSVIKEFLKTLPYTLTAEQRRALFEILKDIREPHPMNRLLEGEVGSGKTVVAAAAIFEAVRSGYQAAFMAPTEILARQHFATFKSLFLSFDITTGLLTRNYHEVVKRGSIESPTSATLKKGITLGDIDVIIGTHALIQKSVVFKKLALSIVDEQHRFGVRQRAELTRRNKEMPMPHFLSLTATPIPRTYAQLLYGGLDISILEEMPPGRKKIVTRIVGRKEAVEIYEFIRRGIGKGRQLYVICPLIMESDMLGFQAVTTEEQKLKKIFTKEKVGILHGRMSGSAKEKAMEDFSKGRTDILISTAVVEVGIDVPNASLMMIESPERFGLSQLHQFRGRIGRGEHQSYCFLMIGTEETVNKRLQALEKTESGFKLSEIDLKTRGPGEFYGIKQSGFLNLKIASLADVEILQKIRHLEAQLPSGASR